MSAEKGKHSSQIDLVQLYPWLGIDTHTYIFKKFEDYRNIQ